jgi:HK97 family phage prohead protease
VPYFITDSAADCAGWATIKDDGEVIGCHTTKQDAIDQMIAVSIAEDIEPGGERAPAPASDQIQGSEENEPDSAQGAGGSVTFSEATTTALRNKVTEHNDKMAEQNKPDYTRTTLGQLKAVYRRGSGAYSTSHRPGISRAAWSMARVNAFLYLLRNGRPENPNYVTDNDLLPEGHPRSTRSLPTEDRALPDNYRPSLSADVPEGRACGNCYFYDESNIKEYPDGELRAYCEKWDDYVNGAYYCNAWQPHDDMESPDEDIEERQVNLTPPAYMRAAARRGLELNAQGFGGDGLTDKTLREARAMANGQVSEDKWRRIAPWIARHMVDLDAPSNRNPDDPGYPGAGLVAHLLWGSGVSKASAMRAMNYAESIVSQLDKEEQNSRWSSIAIQLDKDKEDKSMTTKVERRIKTDVDFEIRLEPDTNNGMRFTGYAAVFNSDSEPLPFTERIAPGAFKRSLKARNEIKMFVNHNMDMVLASTRAKTLKLTEDSKGLLAEAELPDTSYGRDLSVLMQRGDVNAMSFGFSVPQKGDRWSDDGRSRELLDIRLHEVSIVTGFPAYQATTASVRTLEIVASRTNTDVDKLADALLKLESGEALNAENADLITEVVTKLRDDKPLLGSFNNLDIKRKQLDLVYKAL